MKYVRRLSIGIAGTFAVLAGISGYRAIVQVYSLTLRVPDTVRVGTNVGAAITSSGRNGVSITLALIQGARAETLGVRRVRDNHLGTFISQSLNPFPVRDSLSVAVPAEVLARFAPGPATLRSVGLGRSQWMRVPPPTVRERSVVLAR